jgi:hypothetical protein
MEQPRTEERAMSDEEKRDFKPERPRALPPIPGMRFPELGLTDEELRRRAEDPTGWVTAAEVEARLDQLKGVQ